MPWLLLHMVGSSATCAPTGEWTDLSDFGLAISPCFDLSTAEIDFAERMSCTLTARFSI